MKLKVAVLMGGPSAEREVSLVTGKAIFDNLNREKYSPTLVEMSKDNKFFIVQKNKKSKFDFLKLAKTKFNMVFIAMHGTPGEDGQIQALLQTLGIKYTGPEVLSSALAMNKVFSAQIYAANGLPYPEFIHFKKDGWKRNSNKIINDIVAKLSFPLIIKPVDQGSAVGVSKIKSSAELKKVIDKTIKKFPWLMAQKFISGQEATCGVLERDGELMALPPTHILPNFDEIYDYKSKYSKGGSTHICPADFGDTVNQQIENLAIAAHRALNCRGMSRTDIFVGDDKNLYILETNTIPGMTPTSLFPEAAAKAGINFSKMLDYVIQASL
ncbi:MAG TPA: D-alanine--D-alanine ligase [Candidatus Udaeobacter sp.]|nr:D-alanine--D-alanine ligase [Candidatus Udaeobacter sp.]